MTQEDKELLLKDLCARLPYGVKVWYPNGSGAISTVKGIVDDICYFNENPKHGNFCRIETVKPYLRPMSSMTKEEKNEWISLMRKEYQEQYPYSAVDTSYHEYFPTIESFDYLNSHHFDYRGLIPMELALEAPEEMYKTQ